MRIALFGDIHGNGIALEAVLAELEQEPVDRFVCLGDVAATGPQPQAVMERVQALGCPVIMGNADAELIDLEPYPAGDAAHFGAMDRWCAAQLSPPARDAIRAFVPTHTEFLTEDVTLLCYHGSPRSYNDVLAATTPEAELGEMLGDTQAILLAGGHTHFQLVRRFGTQTIINPGSVGLAYTRTRGTGEIRLAPWAEYTVLAWEDGRPQDRQAGKGRLRIDLRRTFYDAAAFRAAILASGMPHADWWAGLVAD